MVIDSRTLLKVHKPKYIYKYTIWLILTKEVEHSAEDMSERRLQVNEKTE